jgi:hypothetical protein
MIENIVEKIFYAAKAADSLLSGYRGLQCRSQFDLCIWEDVATECAYRDPHWVCVLFWNGKHLPLPFFTKKGFWKSESFLQNLVLLLFRNTEGWRKAKEQCLLYEQARRDSDKRRRSGDLICCEG